MARTTDRPASTTRRRTTATKSETRGLGSLDEQDQDDRSGDNDERREGLTAVRDKQDDQREDSGDSRDEQDDHVERESSNGRLHNEVDENRHDERGDSGERTGESAQASRSVQQPTIPEAYAPVLDAWKQVFTSWSELTETMMKAQQNAFASMISGANIHAKDLNLGENRNGERAFSGSRTMASTPETIDRDRR